MLFFDRQQSARRRSGFFLLQFILLTIPCVLGMYVATLFSVSLLVNGLLSKFGLFDSTRDAGFWTFYLVSGVFYTFVVLWVLIARKRGQLARTDDYVAGELQAQRVSRRNPQEEVARLQNIVEEMSIAAGIPQPTIYVWGAPDIINSFAIGHSESDAAIFVTRGAVDSLTRDEMQALVGYGMSQVLNGDMALNVRLAAYVYAFKFAPRVTNFFLFFPKGSKGVKFVEGVFAWLFIYLWIGLALALVTYPQWFATRVLQVSIGRERQKLADASALQFTRNPEAVKGLFLKAIALGTVTANQSRLLEDLAHACFAAPYPQHGFLRMHRPLEKRLRTLDPAFNPARIPELAREAVQQVERRQAAKVEALEAAAHRIKQLAQAGSLAAKIGGFVPALAAVADSVDALTVLGASGDSRALLIAMLLDAEPQVRHRQLAAVRARFGDESMLALSQSVRALRPLSATERTLALDTHLPELRELPRAELERLAQTLEALESVDDSVDVFEYAITRRALVFIRDLLEPRVPHGKGLLTDFADELQLVFSVIAQHSAPGTANAAYDKGMRRLSMNLERAYQPTAQWGRPLDTALGKLEALKLVAKELMLEGLEATLQFDQNETPEERELLRAIAASLHCPIPR